MIWSVSTFVRSSGTTRPVCLRNGFMNSYLVTPIANVDEMTGDCGSGGHRGTDEMRASAATLTAFEISVAGGGAALAFAERVGIHAETHGASGLTPFRPRVDEHAIEAFLFRLRFDDSGTRNDHGVNAAVEFVSAENARCFAEIFETAIGARADKHAVHRDSGDAAAGFESH